MILISGYKQRSSLNNKLNKISANKPNFLSIMECQEWNLPLPSESGGKNENCKWKSHSLATCHSKKMTLSATWWSVIPSWA